jgi:hypothetical protein
MSAKDIQVGGGHYKKYKIQPTEFIHKNNIPFIEGNIVKYVIRHRDKNGIQDLLKAKHYIDLLIELDYHESKEKFTNPEGLFGAERNTQSTDA